MSWQEKVYNGIFLVCGPSLLTLFACVSDVLLPGPTSTSPAFGYHELLSTALLSCDHFCLSPPHHPYPPLCLFLHPLHSQTDSMTNHIVAPKTPKANRSPQGDRFIPKRSAMDGDLALFNLCTENHNPQTPGSATKKTPSKDQVQIAHWKRLCPHDHVLVLV